MGVEVERKFLLANSSWRAEVTGTLHIRQGFLSTDPERVVRVRLVDEASGYLTVKGLRVGHSRPEFEYGIPAADASYLLDRMCVRPLLEKKRHLLGTRAPGEWIVDEFEGENQGLTVCEVEFGETDTLVFPSWLGREVSADDRYANACLQRHPFTRWAGN